MAIRIKKFTEDAFQRQVMDFAKLRGWRRAHFRKAQTKRGNWVTPVAGDGKGFPDLLLIHPATGTLIVAELKVPPNKATPEQLEWLAWFRDADIAAYVWFPADWDRIVEVLTR